MVAKPVRVLRREIGQPTVLGPAPNQLIWVDLRRIGRQVFRDDLGMFTQVRPHQLRFVMDVAAVPQDRKPTVQPPLELLQELHDMLAPSVRVVGQQVEEQIHSASLRTDSQTADRRYAVAAIPAVQHRFAATWRPRSADGRRQHVARFIEKNEMGAALAGGIGDARKLISSPKLDRRVIAFASATTGLLRRPVETGTQDATDMVVVKRDAEVPPNKLRNASTGPQTVRPTVALGTLLEEFIEATKLVGRQAWRRAGLRLGGQAVGLAGQGQPAVHGNTIDADDTCDRLGTLAPMDSVHRLPAAAFELRCSSKWSTHMELDAAASQTIHCQRSWQ